MSIQIKPLTFRVKENNVTEKGACLDEISSLNTAVSVQVMLLFLITTMQLLTQNKYLILVFNDGNITLFTIF